MQRKPKSIVTETKKPEKHIYIFLFTVPYLCALSMY